MRPLKSQFSDDALTTLETFMKQAKETHVFRHAQGLLDRPRKDTDEVEADRNTTQHSRCLSQALWMCILLSIGLSGCGVKQRRETVLKPPASEMTAPGFPAMNRMKANSTLSLCPRMKVSNAPPADAKRRILDYRPYIGVKGVVLALAPVRGACLSSGFGRRRSSFGKSREHKGLDFHQRPAGQIYAAGDGKIIEAKYRKDYGYTVVMSHGGSVYTRYAHLARFAKTTRVGQRVRAGTVLGKMGSTGSTKAVHLHYEVLVGNYDTPKKTFGLNPQNPFAYPAATEPRRAEANRVRESREGSRRSADRALLQAQKRLAERGYDPGRPDGRTGPRTRRALKAFQGDHQIPLTGRLDAATKTALGF